MSHHNAQLSCKYAACSVSQSILSNHIHLPDDMNPLLCSGDVYPKESILWSPAKLKLMQPHQQLLHNTAVQSVLVLLTSWHSVHYVYKYVCARPAHACPMNAYVHAIQVILQVFIDLYITDTFSRIWYNTTLDLYLYTLMYVHAHVRLVDTYCLQNCVHITTCSPSPTQHTQQNTEQKSCNIHSIHACIVW